MAASLGGTRTDASVMEIVCDIEATVSTGFENVAKEEAEEKFNTEVSVSRGRILVKRIPIQDVRKILDLGSIDNCRVLMTRETNFHFSTDLVDCMQRLREFVKKVDWSKGLDVWHQFFSFDHPIAPRPDIIPETLGEVIFSVRTPKKGENKKNKRIKGKRQNVNSEEKEEIDSNSHECVREVENIADKCLEMADKDTCTLSLNVDDLSNKKSAETTPVTTEAGCIDNGTGENKAFSIEGITEDKTSGDWDPLKPSFRVTCLRTGGRHCFDSMTAAANFGGAVNDYFGWNVKMTEFDIEVMLIIDDEEVAVGVGLTKQSLHKRNIVSFGPTTLRPTIAFSMLRMCAIQAGDIVCDPMCGSGSIPIQASISWPRSAHLCGEIHPKALARTSENVSHFHSGSELWIRRKFDVDIVCWDVCCLPLRSNTVDVFVTDMPFGKRSGHRMDNWKLYPMALTEMARVGRLTTGRACILTQDKKCMIKSLQTVSKYWRRYQTLGVNIGGLAAGVYLLHRTATVYDAKQSSTETHMESAQAPS